jgi:Ubiquitin carboxyl-terminal hydrolase
VFLSFRPIRACKLPNLDSSSSNPIQFDTKAIGSTLIQLELIFKNTDNASAYFNSPQHSPLESSSAMAVTLRDCLDLYSTDEPIEEYRCHGCQSNTNSLKKLTYWSLPHYLIISLTRFESHSTKLSNHVSFPERYVKLK